MRNRKPKSDVPSYQHRNGRALIRRSESDYTPATAPAVPPGWVYVTTPHPIKLPDVAGVQKLHVDRRLGIVYLHGTPAECEAMKAAFAGGLASA